MDGQLKACIASLRPFALTKIEFKMLRMEAQPKAPTSVRNNMSSEKSNRPPILPMLWELRKHLHLQFTEGEKREASEKEISSRILRNYQTSPVFGDICSAILTIKEDLLYPLEQLPSLTSSMETLNTLEHYPLPKFFFVSTEYENEPIGFLFHREPLQGGGRVYTCFGFGLEHLTEQVSWAEFRVSKENPEPFVSYRTPEGWLHYSHQTITEGDLSLLAFKALAGYSTYKYPRVEINSIIDNDSPNRKENPYLVKLIMSAMRENIACTRISLPLEIIKPLDLDHLLNIPDSQIRKFMERVVDWGAPIGELLLYERNGQLIMDDDYLTYASYRALNVKMVKAVVIGKFNEANVKVLSRGSGELIPPIILDRIQKKETTPKLKKEELIAKKLSSLSTPSNFKSEMKSKFVGFCRLLGRASTSEKDLHNYIASHPELFDCHLGKMHIEVPIGSYRADLVLQYDQMDKKIVLVELERHVDEIFTKEGRPRFKVTHALQQVEDWIGEIRKGKINMPSWLQKEYVVEGVVVIGRSKNLSKKEKDTLRNLNSNRTVKIITYDDLLERMLGLISI